MVMTIESKYTRDSGEPSQDERETERHTANEIAELREELGRAQGRIDAITRVLDSTQDGYVEVDEALRYVLVNEAAARINGYSREAHIGRAIEDLFPGFNDTPLAARYRKAIAEGIEDHFELYFEPLNRWFQISHFPHKGGLLARFRDVTDQKEAEKVLVASQARMRRLVEAGNIGVVFWEGDRLIDGNDALVAMLGYTREELAQGDVRWTTITPSEYRIVDEQALAQMAEKGVSAPFEKEYVTKSGRRQPVLMAAARWDGETNSGVAWIVDISDRKQAEGQREAALRREEAARKVAEEASRMKDEFLSILSHELRTPLNAVVGWSYLLRTGSVPENERDQALDTIERNARAQARLIEDLLDVSRIVQGKMVLSVGPIEMMRVVESALETVRPAADAKGVRLQSILDSHATILGDVDRLQQVVWNLVANAIKFTSKGGRVQVSLRREASYVEVIVADTGRGIVADFLPHVFDRFRQGDSTATRPFGGLGLGLAIVRNLVELHGGTVTAASDGVDLGATFTVRLPTAPLRADASSFLVPDSGAMSSILFERPPALKGLRVLVVDDEADTRGLLTFLFTQCEARVTCAESAVEAFTALQRETFDVMLSEVGMPDEDGLALIRRIRCLPREHNGDIPALALTAYARAEDRTAALKAGFQMHLAKPIEPTELLVVVATLAGGYRRMSSS